MSGVKKPQLLILAVVVVVGVLLILAPRIPSGKNEVPVSTADPLEMRVQEAVALVNGEDPMKGIMMLREVLKEDPDNVQAHLQLGLFSVQSGQYDKAVERFRKVLELDPANNAEAWFFLGRTYATMDSIGLAIEAFEQYKTTVTDTAIRNGVDRFITELNTEKAEQNALR